jgi:hypothetical protein
MPLPQSDEIERKVDDPMKSGLFFGITRAGTTQACTSADARRRATRLDDPAHARDDGTWDDAPITEFTKKLTRIPINEQVLVSEIS